MFRLGQGHANQRAVLTGGVVQFEHFRMRSRPCLERVMRVDSDINEGFETVAKLAQIQLGAKRFDDARLFQPTHTLGHGGRCQVNAAANLREAQAGIFLQQRQNLAVVCVQFKLQSKPLEILLNVLSDSGKRLAVGVVAIPGVDYHNCSAHPREPHVQLPKKPNVALVSWARRVSTDFDFLLGPWHVHNTRLKKRLQGNNDWEEFSATSHNQRLPAGIGNYDDFLPATWRPGYVGMSLRVFNPQTALWSIYWLDNESGGLDPSGLLRNPVVGKFSEGTGVFEGDDMLEGRPIRVRYTWSDTATGTPCWEQAMSADGGVTWENNWRMLFRRQPWV